MRVLITGITGFAGSHLADLLLTEDGIEVFGTLRWRSRRENVEHLEGRVRFLECDLRDRASVDRMLRLARPDRIYHLAAQSFVPASWDAPGDTFITNVVGQVNLLEGVRASGLAPRILVAGSSEEYGLVHPEETPIAETNPLRPLSPYAVSKVAQDLLGYQYARSYGMHIVRTRAFNHTGPRRGHVFMTSNLARQVAEIEAGLREPVLEVGNLEARRDFTDVRDMVRAYRLALEHGRAGEVYNVASGRAWSVAEVVGILRDLARVPFSVRQDPARLRPSDVPLLLGDAGRFRRATGWAPAIPFTRTLSDLLDDWRARVSRGEGVPAGPAHSGRG